eukprot:10949662-Lingulodinium_polyedra.AAC.1
MPEQPAESPLGVCPESPQADTTIYRGARGPRPSSSRSGRLSHLSLGSAGALARQRAVPKSGARLGP